ncbi:MbtH family NRPS accessory protein [Mycobacterium heckeshornense]|nr:MbtH family NRPS accessory protein [Mycobacterium heckeshornense]
MEINRSDDENDGFFALVMGSNATQSLMAGFADVPVGSRVVCREADRSACRVTANRRGPIPGRRAPEGWALAGLLNE